MGFDIFWGTEDTTMTFSLIGNLLIDRLRTGADTVIDAFVFAWFALIGFNHVARTEAFAIEQFVSSES